MTDLIIPVYKPDNKFKRLLEALVSQTVKPDNILIMYTRTGEDDHFPPEFIELAMAAGETRVFELDRTDFDHGGTRAEAVSHSGADIFIMMTMDAIPADDHLIENLIKHLSDPLTGAAYARQLPDMDSSLAEKFTRGFNYPDGSVCKGKEDLERLGIKTFFCSNVCAAYRRDVYDKLGGFIKRTVFNEDMIYAHKLIMNGYKICYEADAGVIHTHEYGPMQQLHRNFDLAVSQAEHPEVFGSVSSESEGKRYLGQAFSYFKKAGKAYLIIPFFINCCFKYLGYLLGKNHKHLPYPFVRALAMNKGYFAAKNGGRKS
ncbi:MAG: glycosyltransferase family 2 protein [Lachnospiraceae bacterium]|nr:glycosyltransferase family 2 protein [Lachnospiraceae bacterium]